MPSDEYVCSNCYRFDAEIAAYIKENVTAKECSFCGAADDVPVAAPMGKVAELIWGRQGPDKYVCGDCFTDPGIKSFIESKASANTCQFCLNAGQIPIAASIGEVAEHINNCLYLEYDEAANQVPWISREGGYLWRTWDKWDLLFDELCLDLPNDFPSYQLSRELISRIDDNSWCDKAGILGNEREQVDDNWHNFCEVTMHRRRYFFSDYDTDEPGLDFPAETLRKILAYAEQVELFKTLEPGRIIYRARYEEEDECFETPGELGPPPQELAIQSNRMSPAGIVMFYGGETQETALREIADKVGSYAVGKFETGRSVIILDLSDIPPIPSLFEEFPESSEISSRTALTFLHHVAEEISRPIMRDGSEHVEYIPTQVVTEYLRSRFDAGDSRIDGIRYSSSVHECHASYVLFATQDNVKSDTESDPFDQRWLKLVETDHCTVEHLYQM